MKTALIPSILACVTLCSATQPEISPTPAALKEKLVASYAGADRISLYFEFAAPKGMTLIQAQDYELMAFESAADNKTLKKAERSLNLSQRDGVMLLQYNINLTTETVDKEHLLDSTLRLCAAKKSELQSFELSPNTKTVIPLAGRTYTFEPKKDSSLELSFDKSGKDDLTTISFAPSEAESLIRWGDKVLYRFKDELPTQVHFHQWSELSYYNYRLLYKITPGFFSFVAVPLEGDASHHIEMKFDDHAFLSEPEEKDAIFSIAPPKGYQLGIDDKQQSIQAYTVGKDGKLQSLQAKLTVESHISTSEETVYLMRAEFPRYPEGKEVMVDDSIKLSIWKTGDEASKQETSTPLRFRFKPLTVEKVKEVKKN